MISKGVAFGYVPFLRYASGMAYEHSSIFVFLNAYFLIKELNNPSFHRLLLYTLTLFLVFTFHGGGAIFLLPVSLLIFFNALLFRKLSLDLLKKGLAAVAIASIFGNAWMLSMIKYGLPENIGAAAPILDKLLRNKHAMERVVKMGAESVTILNITLLHLIFVFASFFGYLISFFTKRRFLNSSFILIAIGIFFVYFAPNLGLHAWLVSVGGRTTSFLL